MDQQSGIPQALCPSSKCQPGAQLLGVVKEDGRVDLLQTPITIDAAFVARAKQGPKPELRFRFAHKCIKSGCVQWTGTRCGIIDRILVHVGDAIKDFALPECGIRPSCRWYLQNGAEACKVCPHVATEVMQEEGAAAAQI